SRPEPSACVALRERMVDEPVVTAQTPQMATLLPELAGNLVVPSPVDLESNRKRRCSMVHQADIREQMEVVGSDGKHVGTVDHLAKSGLVKLTKGDASDGKHHLFPVSWVEKVDQKVHLNKSSQQAKQQWQTAA